MATPLETLTAALEPTGMPVLGKVPSNVTKPTIVLGIERLEPGGIGRQRRWTIAVSVLSAIADPEGADLDLEAAVGKVLDAIDKAQPVRWTQAESGAINDAFNAIKISVEILTQEG